jgi:hypothetical protein
MNSVPICHPAVFSTKKENATVLCRENSAQELLEINETAAYILNLCNGKNCIGDIAKEMSSSYNIALSQSSTDVAFVIGALRDYGIIAFKPWGV